MSENEINLVKIVTFAWLLFWAFLSVWIFSRTNELKCPCRFDKNYVKSRFTKVKLITWVTNHWHLIARFLECLFQQTLSRCVKANRATAAFRYC